MNKKYVLVLFSGLTLLIFSCNTSKHISAIRNNKPNVDTANANSVNSKLKENNFSFEWLSGKAKITLVDKDGSRSANASFRIRRDSVIWMSISALGIEGFRILITPDSIRIIDRLDRKYIVKDYSFFSQYTSIPVDYKILQNIITGVPLYFDEKKLKAHKEDTAYVLLSDGKKKSNTIMVNPDYTVLNMNLVDSTVGRSLKLKYKNYDRGNVKPFALDRELDLDDSQDTEVLINFSKVIINQPLKFPFNVKEKYE